MYILQLFGNGEIFFGFVFFFLSGGGGGGERGCQILIGPRGDGFVFNIYESRDITVYKS